MKLGFLILGLLLCLLYVSSCKSPASIDANQNEPQRFSDAFLSRMYTESMEECYSYMFDHSTSFECRGTSYGTYCAGIKGMVLYSSFARVELDYLSQEKGIDKVDYNDFYDIQKFELLAAGLPVFSSGQKKFKAWGIQKNGRQDFHHYNPAFMQWAFKHLVPQPNTLIADVKAVELYQAVFSRYFRMMAETHQYLLHKGYSQEVSAYQRRWADQSFDGLRYLNERYATGFESYRAIKGVSTMTAPMAIGFWLRRKIDGTDQILWKGISDFLKIYDGEWYRNKLHAKK